MTDDLDDLPFDPDNLPAAPQGTRRAGSSRRLRQLAAMSMYMKGMTQREIGDELGVAQTTISNYIRDLEDEWAKAARDRVAQYKAREEARLWHLWREACQAWEDSKGGERGPNKGFLSEMRQIAAAFRELWGVEAPVQQEHRLTDSEGRDVSLPPMVVVMGQRLGPEDEGETITVAGRVLEDQNGGDDDGE